MERLRGVPQRRRVGDEDAGIVSKDQGGEDTEDDSRLRLVPCLRRSRFIFSWRLLVLLAVGGGFVVHKCARFYYDFEKALDDPFLEAKLFMPVSFFSVRYWQSKPNFQQRVFAMDQNHTFVVNLETDASRLQAFRKRNSGLQFQRFPATLFCHNTVNNCTEQEKWMEKYPSLQHLANIHGYGDAGVTISHLRLMKRLVNSPHLDYLFIFEDDALLEKELLETRQVLASADADIVFLMMSATKTVAVPYRHPQTMLRKLVRNEATKRNTIASNDKEAVRVVSGHGTFGYILTKEGAQTFLREFQRNHHDAIDVGMMKLAVHSLKIFLPNDHWPLVYHHYGPSTKHQLNKKNIKRRLRVIDAVV